MKSKVSNSHIVISWHSFNIVNYLILILQKYRSIIRNNVKSFVPNFLMILPRHSNILNLLLCQTNKIYCETSHFPSKLEYFFTDMFF